MSENPEKLLFCRENRPINNIRPYSLVYMWSKTPLALFSTVTVTVTVTALFNAGFGYGYGYGKSCY